MPPGMHHSRHPRLEAVTNCRQRAQVESVRDRYRGYVPAQLIAGKRIVVGPCYSSPAASINYASHRVPNPSLNCT